MLFVPLQFLESADTTRSTLKQLCRERGISFGVDDSGASLKASLVRCNAFNRTTWGARMMWMANYVRGEAQEGHGDVESFHKAMIHPQGVGVDQPPVPTQPPFTTPPGPSRPSTTLTTLARAPSPSPARPPIFPPTTPPTHSGSPSRRSPLPFPAPPLAPITTPPSLDVPVKRGTPHAVALPSGPLPAGAVSGDRMPSSHHAALFFELFSAEQAARLNTSITEFNELRWLVVNIATAVSAGAESAATATTRLDGAMAKVLQGNADVTAAAAAIKGAVPFLRGSVYRPSKWAKAIVGARASVGADGGGGAADQVHAADGGGDAHGAAGAGAAAMVKGPSPLASSR